jgi:hypothetical protein
MIRDKSLRAKLNPRIRRINDSLHDLILLRETGPKSAVWHDARVRTIWRMHALLDRALQEESSSIAHEGNPPDAPPRAGY